MLVVTFILARDRAKDVKHGSQFIKFKAALDTAYMRERVDRLEEEFNVDLLFKPSLQSSSRIR
jgi:hypothetical protein